MPTWITLVVAALVGVLGMMLDRRSAQAPTEEAKRRPELRSRLQSKIAARKARMAGSVALCVLLVCSGGCASKMILIPPGEPVRLLQDISAKVESVDKDGKTVVGRATIPAGWYAMPDSGEVRK